MVVSKLARYDSMKHMILGNARYTTPVQINNVMCCVVLYKSSSHYLDFCKSLTTVPLNYNFIFPRVEMRGNTTRVRQIS